ncbi:winged helix-turn-helix domain-containing protein [Parasynechococcus sp.]|uniref:winged helix-turn-helix domain-containing protein n=1 Tax=Parasynechococcus sp. TaxID=3101203 RepID=UPI003704CBA2
MQINPIERSVMGSEREIHLSQREFELLLFLVKQAGEVQSRQTILDAVWGSSFVADPNTLDVYMGYLRKKVESKGQQQLLHTVRGVGFMARVGEPKF